MNENPLEPIARNEISRPTTCLIICAYNAERYLPECLDSVANQTVTPDELIVVNDGSEDDTGIIAEDFASSHSFCHVVHKQNEGLLLARRSGLAQCRCDYVMFLDSDDTLKPNAIERAVERAMLNNLDIVVFRSTGHRDFSPSRLIRNPKAALYEGGETLKRMVLTGNINTMWGKLFRFSLFDMDLDYSRFARLMHGEDLLQLLPIFESAEKVEVIDEYLYYYRPNETSSTSSYKPEQREDIFVVLTEVSQYADKWGIRPGDSPCWARNVVFLLSLLFDDDTISATTRLMELNVISTSVWEYFNKDAGSVSSVRLDYRLILHCLMGRHYQLLGALVGLRKVLLK